MGNSLLFTLATIVSSSDHRILVRSLTVTSTLVILWERLWALSFVAKEQGNRPIRFPSSYFRFEIGMEVLVLFLAAKVQDYHRCHYFLRSFQYSRLKISCKRGHRRKQFSFEIRFSDLLWKRCKPNSALIPSLGWRRIEVNHMTVCVKIPKAAFSSPEIVKLRIYRFPKLADPSFASSIR